MVILVDWSELPSEMLMQIAENHIISVHDFVMFSCVCHSWNRAASGCHTSKLRETWTRQMPWLMLANFPMDYKFMEARPKRRRIHDDSDDERPGPVLPTNRYDIYGLSDPHFFDDIDPQLYRTTSVNLSSNRNRNKDRYDLSLPEAYARASWGSPYGWVVTLARDQQMHLLNPLTKARLPLPPKELVYSPMKRKNRSIRDAYITKAVVLPMPSDCSDDVTWYVVTLYYWTSSLVAIAKPGDTTWTQIHQPIIEEEHDDGIGYEEAILMDVLYSREMKSLLFVNIDGSLYSYKQRDIGQPEVCKEFLRASLTREHMLDWSIQTPLIVESNGDLLLVVRYQVTMTMFFKVYKVDKFSRTVEEVRDLGGVAVFLGRGNTVSISAEVAGCRSNCIYFTEDDYREYLCHHRIGPNNESLHDIGVFSLDDGTIQTCSLADNLPRSYYGVPFWYSPSI